MRSPKTVNLYIAAVLSFYKYLYEFSIYDDNLSQYYTENKPISPKYKDFLYHIHTGEGVRLNKLYVKEKKKRIEILQQEEVNKLIQAANNTRDKFLLYLLFVSGLRIGEALSLYNEDVIFDHKHGHRIVLKDRNIVDLDHQQKAGERSIFINQECMDMYDDYQYEMLDSINKDSDYVFVKLSGDNKGEPMSYNDVHSMFLRLNKKTGIKVTPHVIRHTHATIYYEETKNPKALQERLGHSNIQTTMNMYVHPSRKTMLAEWNTAQKRFNNVGKFHDK